MTHRSLHPNIILGIAAHPDDLEFGMAGSIANWIKQGATAYYLLLTNGNKGSADRSLSCSQLTEIRRKEQMKAGNILGLQDVFFLDHEDGSLEVTMQLKKEITRIIRQTKPDVVLTFDPSMLYHAERGIINHSDHRAAGQATIDAVYPLARDHLAFPDLIEEGLQPHKTGTLLLKNFGNQNYYVDITDTLDIKLAALRAHASQIPDPRQTDQLVTDWAKEDGQKSGHRYAEGFLRIDIA